MATNDIPQVDFEEVLEGAGMPVTPDEANAEFEKAVEAQGMITNTSSMSPFWRLITVIVTTPVMWIKDALVNAIMPGMFVATATGKLLDLLAWGLRLSRKQATAAKGTIYFTKQDATAVVTVPAGTVIQTERINGVIYSVTADADYTIDAGSDGAEIPVTATGTGTAYDLAPGYYHILPTAVDGIASATNDDNWLVTPGADQESDDELRERCRNQYNLLGNYHTDAVYRSMIASVAGLSIDRVFFEHDAPRGPGTANAYLLLDTGVASDPFIAAVNTYINDEGHHGHGDDMQCFALPDTQQDLTVTLYVASPDNMTDGQQSELKTNAENLVRCAFRENADYDVEKTWPYSRFSFSKLGQALHRNFAVLDSVEFSLTDIVSDLNVPRLNSLSLVLAHD
ncbi:baseplate J/gp47 family protein [Citrobacter sp. FP75]|uniref:baseplate J/gp47 family protein n=1 Tax=Citrobacter sp. FP75 TaxID=1852949 RepID=UPI001BC8CD3E|nr:baseplate J/gp47 family protein [Citrobacter sp. FP75]